MVVPESKVPVDAGIERLVISRRKDRSWKEFQSLEAMEIIELANTIVRFLSKLTAKE